MIEDSSASEFPLVPTLDTSVPHSARVWNYWLGGKDNTTEANVAGSRTAQQSGLGYHLRSPEQVAGFFDGLELAEPGVVTTPRWRPDSGTMDDQPQLAVLCGVARKP